MSKKTKTKPKFDADKRGEGLLDYYFREMSKLDVLEPKQEFEFAKQIEDLDTESWEVLFSYPPVVPVLVDFLKSMEGTPGKELLAVRRAANDARRHGTVRAKERLEKVATKAAETLQAEDQDRVWLLATVDLVEALAEGRAKQMGLKVYFSPSGKHFKDFYARLQRKLGKSQQVREEFVRANLRLVVSIARRFNHGRMPLVDLIQEGNLGLIKAVERFDRTKGFRFSTYASWWIRHAVSRALADKGRTVRLPVHVLDAKQRMSNAERELTSKLGRAPTSDEVATEMAITQEKLDSLKQATIGQVVSLDSTVGESETRQVGEQIEDPNVGRDIVEDNVSLKKVVEEMMGVLGGLKPIEADIIRYRFGLGGREEETLKEIGSRYNLSRERIRQLQEQALSKMRRALGQFA